MSKVSANVFKSIVEKLYTVVKQTYQGFNKTDDEEFNDQWTSAVDAMREELKVKVRVPGGRKRVDGRPKRSRSAYTFYQVAARPKMKEANPEAIQKELTALIASEWQRIKDTDEALPFKAMEQEDRER